MSIRKNKAKAESVPKPCTKPGLLVAKSGVLYEIWTGFDTQRTEKDQFAPLKNPIFP